MPATRLRDQPIRLHTFDVVGQDSDTLAEFICHIGLAADDRPTHSPADPLRITDMGPPLTIARDGGQIHTHGAVPLTEDERLQIRLFIDEHRREYEAQSVGRQAQYCIRPHSQAYRRQDADKTVQFRRFSCAGFVIEAYADAGVDLLVTEESRLPPVTLDLVCAAYPDFAEQLRIPHIRARLNLSGEGGWPIVLPAYLLNALHNRSRDAILNEPYLPQVGDEYFPPRRGTPTTATTGV